jgi:hypothetical protein
MEIFVNLNEESYFQYIFNQYFFGNKKTLLWDTQSQSKLKNQMKSVYRE